MTVHLSRAEARRFLALYHFTPTDIPGVLERLGTVQYDPLNPVGRNPDLVFQARVPGYAVDDWQQAAYTDRLVYDAWDKMACLVPISDWPMRTRLRAHTATWTPLLLEEQAEAVAAALAELDARGPLSSLEFEDQSHFTVRSSWYGPKRIKHILRALWDRGLIVTHHRQGGRHYYDRAERVIPPEYFNAPPLEDEDESARWMVARRSQTMGLIRPVGEYSIWFGCGATSRRASAFKELVEMGTLTPVQIGENGAKGWPAYLPTSALPLLEAPASAPRVIFLGPLDSLLWDRRGVMQLFDFDYVWEVYKPEPQRRWGYYVLPVFYKDRFVARLDSRLEKGTWTIARWWWEPDIVPDADMLDALRLAVKNFLCYLRVTDVRVNDDVNTHVRTVLSHKT
ncbi:MAG TPA: crosslink repair DNA glycosylase YcaQ family protein [Ktedonobacteraceae bacterium]|nr:crosslink repair DNA glycosylase YcaQ family protein [Ktedonobacteraceae bacterium]